MTTDLESRSAVIQALTVWGFYSDEQKQSAFVGITPNSPFTPQPKRIFLNRIALHVVKRNCYHRNLDTAAVSKIPKQHFDLLIVRRADLASEIVNHSLRFWKLQVGKCWSH
jgi:hypothetical protein